MDDVKTATTSFAWPSRFIIISLLNVAIFRKIATACSSQGNTGTLAATKSFASKAQGIPQTIEGNPFGLDWKLVV